MSPRDEEEEARILGENALLRAKFVAEHGGREPSAIELQNETPPPAWAAAQRQEKSPAPSDVIPDIVLEEDDPPQTSEDFLQNRESRPSGAGSALQAETIALAFLDVAQDRLGGDASPIEILSFAEVWALIAFSRSVREHTAATSAPQAPMILGFNPATGKYEERTPDAR